MAIASSIIAATIAGAATATSGALAYRGATAQASAAKKASQRAVDEQIRQFDITRSDQMPWLQAGGGALAQLSHLLGIPGVPQQPSFTNSTAPQALTPQALMRLRELEAKQARKQARGKDLRPKRLGELQGLQEMQADYDAAQAAATAAPVTGGTSSTFDPSTFGSLMRDFSTADFETDPGYEFRLGEGLKALERSASSRGGLYSGGTLKALARYNQDFASNEFGNAYNRFQSNRATRYNQLANLAGLGQTSAQNLGVLGQRSAENIGNITIGGQTAAAAARASGYNALGQTIGQIGQLPLNWMMLSQLNSGGYNPGSSVYGPSTGSGGTW